MPKTGRHAVLRVNPPNIPITGMDALLVAFAVLVLALWASSGSRSKRLPPGPPTLPLLGNLHLVPSTGLHLKYTKWAQTYGSIFSLKIGNWPMIVLNTALDAGRVMDKRSLHYSDRPASHVIGDLVFEGNHPMFMDANERWKLRRKLYHQILQESVCNKQHIPLLEAESAQLLRDIALEPNDLMLHPGRFSNSIMMSMIFGVRTPTHNAPHYLKLRDLMTTLSGLGEMGATPPVDILPMLKYLPEKLWGNWKTRARLLREKVFKLYSPLVDHVIERRDMGKKLNSFLDGLLEQKDDLGFSRDEIDVICGNLLEGGTDTMATLILTLAQAMALHPEIQAEVHAHLDSVIDDGKLPTWADYERLPYITMLVKELHRWRPPAPAGFPHVVDKDDEVDGLRIPKGSAVIINIWGIHHDADRWQNPETFNPHRYKQHTQLASVYANSGDYQNRDHFGYGIGRRICPGIHLAERALFLAVARIMWAFSFQQKKDATGKLIPIDVSPATGYRDGFLNQCFPFEVDIKVRSQQRLDTILASFAEAEANVFRTFA
ncbi:cytochrome P450 2D18 [Xylaria intraflava]|nr:cytochrome P450 2D18 [Xylaria intraflava]